MRFSRKFMSQYYATTVGVLVVIAVFVLAIGIALVVQTVQRGEQVWPFTYFMK
jgi:hypothetical protein